MQVAKETYETLCKYQQVFKNQYLATKSGEIYNQLVAVNKELKKRDEALFVEFIEEARTVGRYQPTEDKLISLNEACKIFLVDIAKTFGIYKLLTWITKRLKK